MKALRLGLAFDGTLSPDEMLMLAQLAEDQGLDALWMAEDLFYRDSISMTAAFARETERIGLSTFVSPYTRSPVLTAMSLATLDELSGGRVFPVLGTGNPLGLRQMGINLRRPLAHIREFIRIFRDLMQGDAVKQEGRAFTIDNVKLSFTPSRSGVPVFVAAMREKMMALAAQEADGILLTAASSVPYVQAVSQTVADHDVELASYIIAVADPEPDVLDDVRLLVGYLLRNEGMRDIIDATGISVDQAAFMNAYKAGDTKKLKAMVTPEVLDAFTVVGTADQCGNRLKEYVAAGLDRPILLPVGAPDIQAHTVRAVAGLL